MTTPMPPLRALACSIALAAVFGGAYAGAKTASAAADPPNYDGQPVGAVPVFPSTSPLGQSTSPSSRFVAAAPEVCFGRTENPHNSRHYPGNVLVSSRSECPPYAVTVTIDLYRVVFGIMQFLDRGTNTGMGTAVANARWECPSGSTSAFVGVGYHTASGHLAVSTRNEQTVTCS
jgi:hypothetical protein